MKKSFLENLKGKSGKDALIEAIKAGYQCEIYNHDSVIIDIAVGNMVNLWIDGDVVVDATAGDPLEVENDI